MSFKCTKILTACLSRFAAMSGLVDHSASQHFRPSASTKSPTMSASLGSAPTDSFTTSPSGRRIITRKRRLAENDAGEEKIDGQEGTLFGSKVSGSPPSVVGKAKEGLKKAAESIVPYPGGVAVVERMDWTHISFTAAQFQGTQSTALPLRSSTVQA